MEQWFSCSAHRIWWSDLFSVPAEIRRHGCRSRHVTESVTVTFGRNRKYAESVKIYFFGAETETEIRSNIKFKKRVVDFLLVLIEHFARCYGWGATSENRLKIGVLPGCGSVSAKFSCRTGRRPPIIFAEIDRSMNALQVCRWQFSHKETL